MAKKRLLICFTGIDGSGKTTIARRITEYLKEKDFPAVYVYGRLKLFIAKPLMVLGNKMFLSNHSITKNYGEYSETKKHLFRVHNYLQKIYLNMLLFDYVLQLKRKISFPLSLGKTIVCDRYIYDTIITDLAVDMNFKEEEIFTLLDKCFSVIPQPDITFLIDVDEDIAYSRKNDVPDKGYLKDRRAFYLKLANHYDIQNIDGNKTLDEVFADCRSGLENELDV